MTTDAFPTQLQRPEAHLVRVTWSDGRVLDYSAQTLREHCPCATCREKHGAPVPPATALPVLSIEETRPLQVASMKPVGNYAYAIQFSDGHQNGIFTFQLLRSIGSKVSTDE